MNLGCCKCKWLGTIPTLGDDCACMHPSCFTDDIHYIRGPYKKRIDDADNKNCYCECKDFTPNRWLRMKKFLTQPISFKIGSAGALSFPGETGTLSLPGDK